MTEQKTGTGMLGSKFWRAILLLAAALLTFAGPTYVVYVLMNALGMDQVVSMVPGIVLFLVGLILWWYLIKKRVLS